jgi:molecular chaperone GrpE
VTGPGEAEEPPIRFTDKRRVGRDTEAEAAEQAAEASAPPADETLAATEDPAQNVGGDPSGQADVPTVPLEDLQRLSAEYANYRKRAERDRLAAGDLAIARVIIELLPVVDDLDRAKAHGDLTGALKAVADKLDAVFAKLGLVAFGEVGDPFDPSRHEAVLHDESDAVTVPTCTTIMRQGYLLKDRLVRPAMVGVSDPASGAGPDTADAIEDAVAGSERHTEDQDA